MPHQAGFDLDIVIWTALWVLELAIDVYFVADIFLNFRTPYYDKTGRLVYSGKAMAWNYMKGWFLIDVGSCSSLLQYIFLIFDIGDSSRWRDFCHSADALSPSLLIRLLKGEGVAAVLTELWSTAQATRGRSRRPSRSSPSGCSGWPSCCGWRGSRSATRSTAPTPVENPYCNCKLTPAGRLGSKRLLDRLDDEVLRVLAPIWSLPAVDESSATLLTLSLHRC